MTRDADYLNIHEVAARLDRSVNAARKLLHSGRIPGEVVFDPGIPGGHQYRVRAADVDVYRAKRDRARQGANDPRFAGLRGIVERRDAAKRLVDDLTEERDREIVRLSRAGCVVVDLAAAAGVSTQQIQVIRRTAERDPQS